MAWKLRELDATVVVLSVRIEMMPKSGPKSTKIDTVKYMPYYTNGQPWPRCATTNAEAWPVNSGPLLMPYWNGNEGGECTWCTAIDSFLLAVRVPSVCKGEGGEIEVLVPIILRARPVPWVSLRPCTACSAGAPSSVISTLARTEVRPPNTGPPAEQYFCCFLVKAFRTHISISYPVRNTSPLATPL